MKPQVFFGIVIRIIVLCVFGMLCTFIPDHLRVFFGDTANISGKCNSEFKIDCNWIWGARHYWYAWMMVLLFITSLLNIIIGVVDIVDKHYPS